MVANHTQYKDSINPHPDNDFNTNFDLINEKAADIENWINNLTLLNEDIQFDKFNDKMNVSMLSDKEDWPVKDTKIEKHMINIRQIANSCKLISL